MPPETTAAPRCGDRRSVRRLLATAAAVAAVAVVAAAAAALSGTLDAPVPLPAAAQQPDSTPPSLQGAAQSLDLNAVPPTLTISFDEDVLAAPSGAVPGANMSLVEIVGVSGRPVVGLAGAAVAHAAGSQTTLAANLTAPQHAAASAAHRAAAPLTLTVRYGAVYDASGNAFAGDSAVRLDVVPDTTAPSAAGSASVLNLTDGTLRMYFDEPIDAAAADLDGVTVRVQTAPGVLNATTMEGASASQGGPGELVIAMSPEQRHRLVALRQTGAGSTSGSVTIIVTHTAIPDFAGNHWIGTLFSFDSPDVIDDASGPSLLPPPAWPLLNLRAGSLALYFDEAVNRTSARPGLINITHAGHPLSGTGTGAAVTVGLGGARVASHADSDVLVIALTAGQAGQLRAAAAASAPAAEGGMRAPAQNWTVSMGNGSVRDMAGNPSAPVASAPAAAAHAAPARHACMVGNDGADASAASGPCRYGILGSYGEAAAWSGQAIAVSDDGSRSYVAYGPPPGSRAARIDAVGAQPDAGVRPVIASVEFEPPAPGVSSSVRAVALDGATGALFAAVQEAPGGGGSGPASSYLAPLHPATLSELPRVPLSYVSHNGTAAPGDVPASVAVDAARRLVLAAVSDAPANATSPYRSRGAVLSADADELRAHAMYAAAPDHSSGYYHPYHAWQPAVVAVNETTLDAADGVPATAYVAGAALDAAASASGLEYPSSYGIHTVAFGNSTAFSPNYTRIHSLPLAAPHNAASPDAASFAVASLALDAAGGTLYALYANGTLAAHALASGAPGGPAAGYAVPLPALGAISHGLAAAGPGISLDAARGLLYAAPADLSSVLVYDLRAAGGPALAANVPVPHPVSALAASASDGTVHVLGGMPGGRTAPPGAAAYVVGPGAAPLAFEAPPSADLRAGTLELALDRRADAASIDPSGMVLWGGGAGMSESVSLAGASTLSSGYTAAPVLGLTEGQRRAAAAAYAWDGPLLANVSEGAVQGVVGAPLAAASSVAVRISAAPSNASIVLASAVSPYEVRVEYDAPVNATPGMYAGLSLERGTGGAGHRAVEAVRGAGSAVHILEIDRAGAPLPPDAAGSLEVRRLPDLGSRSTFDGAAAAPVSDAQRPSVRSAVVIDNASVAVFFDEPVTGVEPADFGALLVGAQDDPPEFGIAGVSGSGPYRLLGVADASPPVPRNAHGSLVVVPGSFEDLAGNRGAGTAEPVYVTPGRATATTDGRAPVPATPGMYARAVVASTALGASLDLSPLGGLPLPADGPVILDAFDAAVVLPPGASVAGGMPADGIIRVSGSDAQAGVRASIGGGRILAMADTGGAGGAPVRLDAPAAIVVPGAAGGTAFLQEPGGAPAAVHGACGGPAASAVRPADLRAAAESHLNGTGSCAADLAGDKIVVSFVLTTVGVAERADAGVQSPAEAAVCGGPAAAAGDGGGSGGGTSRAVASGGPAGCGPPHVALLDTGGLDATAVAVAPAASLASAGPVPRATVFVAASAPAGSDGDGDAAGGASILVYDAGAGPSPSASSSLGAGSAVLALEAPAPDAEAPTAEAAAAGAAVAYAVVAGLPAPLEGGDAPPPSPPAQAAALARIDAAGAAVAAAPAPVGLEYVDARGLAARVTASDTVTALHVDAAAGRAYVAVLANASARGGLGTDGPILAVDTASDPARLLRQYAGPYDLRAAAAAGDYYYPAEAWRPTALAVAGGGHGPAYAVGARLLAGGGALADPASGPASYGIQAVSFAGPGDAPAFTPNYTLSAGLEIARRAGGAPSSLAAVPGLPAVGAALGGTDEKLYVLYGNGTLSVYAVGSSRITTAAPAAPPRHLYDLDAIDGPSALASYSDPSGSGSGILYAAGSGGIRAYDMRADMLIGSAGIGDTVDMDASAAGTLYAVDRAGSVRAIGDAATPPALRPSALESLVAATPDGGTALLAPGRYDNVSLVLDRPVRLAADPPGSAVLGPSSRIEVLVPPSGIVAVEGIAFSGTRCPAGLGPSAPGSAAIRVSDGAWAASQERQGLGGSVAILSNSFAGACGAAVSSGASAATGIAVRSNAIESAGTGAGAGYGGAAIEISGLAGSASVESNRVLGAAGYAVSVHNASWVAVSGNHVEDAAGGGISVSSSSAVRITGNTLAGIAGPAVLVRDARQADAAANATGILSDGVAATLNTVREAAVALSVLGPAGERNATVNPPGDAANAPPAQPSVRFNFNVLHAHGGGLAPAISSDAAAGVPVDARSNYYPGLEPGSYPRVAGSAAGSVLADPAAAPPGGPLRIGVLLDAASLQHVDGPALEAARAAADEANRRAAGSATLPPVELVEARGAAAGGGGEYSPAAAAARALASGAALDGRYEPVLLGRINEAASWHAASPGDALARISAVPYRGISIFAADASGTVLAASAGAGIGGAHAAPGMPHPAAAADPAAFAAAVARLGDAGGGGGGRGDAPATAWLGYDLPDGTVVRTLLAASDGLVLGASYEAGHRPRAYVGPMSAAALAAASAALPSGTPIVSPGAVDGRIVASAGPAVFSMAPASADSSAPVAGQVMSEERVAAVIPVVQADDYSLRFAAAALAEYAARSDGGIVLNSVVFEPSDATEEFWSSAAGGMEAAAAGLALRGLAPHEVAVLYVGGGGPFEALAGQALLLPALAGAQWYIGDAIAQMSQAGQGGAGSPTALPWYAPGGQGSGNHTSAEALSRRTALAAFSFEPARGLGIDPAAAAAAESVLGEIRVRQAASASAAHPAPASAGYGDTPAAAYAYLAYDAVLVLARALPAAEAASPGAPEYGAAIRQAAAAVSSPSASGAGGGIVRGAAFDAGGSLAHPAPYALWVAGPSGPPARAGTIASLPPLCGIALADGRLDLGGVRPGGASAAAQQEIANAGTALLEAVAMDATGWTVRQNVSGPPPAAPALLPAGLTEAAAGRPPPGAPAPTLPPGVFAPVASGMDVLAGLAPGNSVRLEFLLNLTSVPDAPAAPVEQVVTYTAACG